MGLISRVSSRTYRFLCDDLVSKNCGGVSISMFRLCGNIRQLSSNKVVPGIIFDIDGVLLRGNTVLPPARAAFSKLYKNDKFIPPTAFVTNAGNVQKHEKAQQLSEKLEVNITPEQVVMSHTPFESLGKDYYTRFTLISGQGPIKLIANSLGFQNIITVDELREHLPYLDMVDQSTRPSNPKVLTELPFPKIEQIVLFGEPRQWDRNLQLIIDCILTDGGHWRDGTSQQYYEKHGVLGESDTHLPILATNMDLQWQAEAPGPRFGHGTFMACLEAVYRKLTGGKEIKYNALAGKPGLMTYKHSDKLLQSMTPDGTNLGSVYCIGDNIMSDIYGANLYTKSNSHRKFESMLVCTGVYHAPPNSDLEKLRESFQEQEVASFHHAPRDFTPLDKQLLTPSIICQDVDQCIDYILAHAICDS